MLLSASRLVPKRVRPVKVHYKPSHVQRSVSQLRNEQRVDALPRNGRQRPRSRAHHNVAAVFPLVPLEQQPASAPPPGLRVLLSSALHVRPQARMLTVHGQLGRVALEMLFPTPRQRHARHQKCTLQSDRYVGVPAVFAIALGLLHNRTAPVSQPPEHRAIASDSVRHTVHQMLALLTMLEVLAPHRLGTMRNQAQVNEHPAPHVVRLAQPPAQPAQQNRVPSSDLA